jgi:hypothetical protein
MKVTSVTTRMEEKVGLANYSNVTYSATITAEPEGDETGKDVIEQSEAIIEGWMKDYFRREVEQLVEQSAKSK